jgi:tetratricopeptide (TPR) repeat protein
MVTLNDLMLDIRRAYHRGKDGSGSVCDEDQVNVLEQIQQWDYGFLPQEQIVRELCVDLLRTTIQTIRQREFVNADSLIHTMNGLIESSNLSQNNRSVCKSYIEAAAAYLDYKCQRYDQAMRRLQDALAIDEQLELADPIYGYMHLHRIMLLDNWVRVLAHRGQVVEAIDLAFQVLDYLERKVVSLPVPASWDSSHLASYPADLLSVLFRTIVSQIAEAVTGKDMIMSTGEVVPVRDVFACSHHHLSPDAGGCYLSPLSHNWIRMKQAALDENLSAFFLHASQLLAAGPGRLPTLWYATIVEIIILSRRGLNCDSEAFCKEVRRDLVSWPRLLPTWKAIILEAE